MSVNLVKSRTVFFPDIPREIGQQPALYKHFQEIEEEMAKQTVGLYDNDAVLRDALNTAVTVAVTTAGDIPIATGSDWGILPIGAANEIMFVNGTQPDWTTPATLGIPAITAATTGAMIYFAGTTGWMHIASGSEGQYMVYKTDSGRGVWTTDLGPKNDPSTTEGAILYSTNSTWATLSPGATGQVLTMTTGLPQWITNTVAGWQVDINTTISYTGTENTVLTDTLSTSCLYRMTLVIRTTGSSNVYTPILRFATGAANIHYYDFIYGKDDGTVYSTGSDGGDKIVLPPYVTETRAFANINGAFQYFLNATGTDEGISGNLNYGYSHNSTHNRGHANFVYGTVSTTLWMLFGGHATATHTVGIVLEKLTVS